MADLAETEAEADHNRQSQSDSCNGGDGRRGKTKDLWLKQWLMATGAPAKDLAKASVLAVTEYEERLRVESREHAALASDTTPKRKRRPEDQETLARAIELITCHLAYAVLTRGRKHDVAYSRRKGVQATRYDNKLTTKSPSETPWTS